MFSAKRGTDALLFSMDGMTIAKDVESGMGLSSFSCMTRVWQIVLQSEAEISIRYWLDDL